MISGLFINQVKGRCSIYESGVMIFNTLKSDKYDIDYLEISIEDANRYNYSGYDFYLFNWHHSTLPIASSTIKSIDGLKIGIVLEVGLVEIKPFMPEDLFDAYMIIDPTKEKLGKYYPFPRPLEEVKDLLPILSDVPVLGTFGFMVPGKNFGEVLQQANHLKQDCIVRMNITSSDFTGYSHSMPFVKDYCNRLLRFRDKNVDLRITNDYMSKYDLIRWCSQNTLNVFPYYRELPGLGAATDQAIAAGRGIAITSCNTFRHMRDYISYYPEQDYMQLSTSTLPGIDRMRVDWRNDLFIDKFMVLLNENLGST